MKREAPILSRKTWGFSTLGKCTCFWTNGRILFTLGPDWQFNICILTIILAVFAVFLGILAPLSVTGMQLLGFIVLSTNLLSYCLTALLNPGVVLQSSMKDKKQTFCQNCNMFVPENSEHCGDCDLCIEDLDHHCPFSGKCIASGNIAAFYTFLISIFCVFFYFILWVLVNASLLKKTK